jgi:hypothetical protein
VGGTWDGSDCVMGPDLDVYATLLGGGALADMHESCPQGSKHDARGTCWYDRSATQQPMRCRPGTTARAGSCYAQPPSGYDWVDEGSPNRVSRCPEGTTNTGSGGCRYDRGVGTPMSCPDGQVQRGAECYAKPPDGYDWATSGGLLIGKVCPPGTNDSGTTCWYDRGVGTPLQCPAGQVQRGAECFQPPPAGYDWTTAWGLLVGKVCPSGTSDSGTTCYYNRGAGQPQKKTACPAGWRDDGTVCWKDSYGRGAGRVPSLAPCGPGERDDGTSCWGR